MKDFLPIGSVVLLKDAKKRLMICGRVQVRTVDKKVFDYSGCLYPEGMINSKEMYFFNNDDIQTLYYVGMQDEEEFKFRRYMQEQLDKLKKENQ